MYFHFRGLDKTDPKIGQIFPWNQLVITTKNHDVISKILILMIPSLKIYLKKMSTYMEALWEQDLQ